MYGYSVIVSVQESGDLLLQHLIPLIKNIKIDIADAHSCDMGPLISLKHKKRVLNAILQGESEGANLVVDGRDFKHEIYKNGFFLGPCLFDHVDESMSIYQQEIFGPVLVLMRVDTFEDALALVNRNQYGNGTAIFTKQGYYAREYIEKVQVGMVGVNVPIPVPVASHPFGGWKKSSFGDIPCMVRKVFIFTQNLRP